MNPISFDGSSPSLCPTCKRHVSDLRSETPYNPDIEPFGWQVTAMPSGFPRYFAVPCGHLVIPVVDAQSGAVIRLEPPSKWGG